MRSSWSSVSPNPIWDVLIRREETQTHRGEATWRWMQRREGCGQKPRDAQDYQQLPGIEGEAWSRFSLRTSRRNQPYPHLDFGTSGVQNWDTMFILSYPISDHILWQPEETYTMPMRDFFSRGSIALTGFWDAPVTSHPSKKGGKKETLPHRSPDQNMNLWREGFTTFVRCTLIQNGQSPLKVPKHVR